MEELAAEIEKASFKTRRAFQRLSEERQRECARRFRRHAAACRKSEMETDEAFLPELIHDLGKGYEF